MGVNCGISSFILLKFACFSSMGKCFPNNFFKERLEALTCVHRAHAGIKKTFSFWKKKKEEEAEENKEKDGKQLSEQLSFTWSTRFRF